MKFTIRFFLLYAVFILVVSAKAQDKKYLLTDMDTQIEATQAVNNLYNFKFEKAEKEFNWLRYQYPKHPMPYFLIGFSYWWKMIPLDDGDLKESIYDKDFIRYMDSTIHYAEEMYDNDETNIDAIFFLSAAYGFLGRIYSDRRHYAKATWAGRHALEFLKEGKQFIDISPEMLFGEGLYNYYEKWIRENYPLLRPILFFFADGDKELGLTQLETVSKNAFYTRTEAQLFRYIILYQEKRREEAHPIIKYLEGTFPDNAYFQRLYAQSSFMKGDFSECTRVSLDILAKLDSNMVGYEQISGRYAGYFLGYINHYRHRNYFEAEKYYLICKKNAEEIGAKGSSYYHYSILNLARLADKKGDKKSAKQYYKQFIKLAERKDSGYKEAKKYIKANR